MAHSCEDLEKNPLYTALETKYADKLHEAQKKLWLICVPTYKSLKGHSINKDFIDTHILKPSPFFKSHFETTDSNNSMTYEIEHGTIKTNTGEIKILWEETAYNDDYKPYKILIINEPLRNMPIQEDDHPSHISSEKGFTTSIVECTKFLKSFPECEELLLAVDKKLHIFNSSYVALPQYLQDASCKLQSLLKWAANEFFQCIPCKTEDISKSYVSAALENYIMSNVHTKIFPVVKKFCSEEDQLLNKKLLLLYDTHVTPDQLGVREDFCCQTLSAVVELASLNSESRSSPGEKLNCLMTTLELLNQDIEIFLSSSSNPVCLSNKETPRLTSDDLIPLLVNVIVKARPQYLSSNLYYVQNFSWENSPFDKQSFGLVTFQAAKEFLKSTNFGFMKPSTKKFKKEISLEELIEVTVDIQNSTKASHPSKVSTTDHLLENVTKMIEASTTDLRERSHNFETFSTPQKVSQHSTGQETVGDFLSSLRQSSLGLSYGKQS